MEIKCFMIKNQPTQFLELTEEDAPSILQCFSNTDVLRHYGQKPLQNLDQVKQILNQF